MSWMCSCQNQVPDVPPYHWPITLAECHGRESSCMNGCTYGTTKDVCMKACNKYYKCDKAGSPSSGLRVEKEQDKPAYSLTNNANSVVYTMKFTTVCIFFHAYIMNL
ncbi:hypothetical protein EDC94DRAFT_527401 [Helicostylum pulchrum]|nr:hypothetical protein EDC94DRAFT_527401 [Helicostylum pulchrum]